MEIRVGPPTITIHVDDQFAVSQLNAEMSSAEQHGYFVADTRLVSGYRLSLGGEPPLVCDSTVLHHRSARFEFTNPPILDTAGEEIPEHSLHLRLGRRIAAGLHEDYDLTNYRGRRLSVELEIGIESDFADLFDVRQNRRIRRGSPQSSWDPAEGRLETEYRNGPFHRGLIVQVDRAGSPPSYANGAIRFRVVLDPAESWHACLLWQPVIGDAMPAAAPPHHEQVDAGAAEDARRQFFAGATRLTTSDRAVNEAVRQAVDDLSALRMHRYDTRATGEEARRGSPDWVPVGGVPWYVALFGRDALTVSIQTLALSAHLATGSLRALGAIQGDGYDDRRDMQPGKVAHELRQGELATLGLIPHTPYYGTHEATTLYVLVAALAWRWTADRELLDAVRPHVDRALTWLDRDGDLDGDGLQEYLRRTPRGYYNQGWKDAGDAIVDAGGRLAKLPIALCEHQALAAAAKSEWAAVLAEVYGDRAGARRLAAEAAATVAALEDRFWWEEQGTYYLGLDGDKRPIASVASNPGQVLWTGVADPQRARRVAARLMAGDVWGGWGIRTLSADHPVYNPFSYQLGSVWPHDNALAAAGFRCYGLDGEAARIARGLFDAASCFAGHRLPELFSGLPRDPAGFPVPCLEANVPQAWASGALVHLVSMFLGLAPDARSRTLRLFPALPDWLAAVRVENLSVGPARVDLQVTRRPGGGHDLDVGRATGGLEVCLGDGPPPAPL
jgi:glycogen debranching enzyme